ncbi:MAG: glutaminyl-peptide cyclotransferase [Flavisolibacter sp.]|jgi:glutamine cyclotransferase|nr:glutaminyl-peptide cyclotransferase [Flavisolibacter sp.]
MKKAILPVLLFISIVSCTNNDNNPGDTLDNTPKTPVISYSVVNTLPHDTSFFLEGLEFYKGKLVESTGLEGKSKLVEYDPATGKISKQVKLDSIYFGEGITIFRDTVYQMTYKEGVVHVYDAKDFKKIKQLPYKNGEGWGLTHDSTYLIGTNGGNSLHYYEPGTFKLVRSVGITENGVPAINLNELEYINGFVYANQWQYNAILKIDPTKGEVVAKMDLTSVYQQEKAQNPSADSLNGIAYNPDTKKFYITGKNWSKIYELRFDL